MTTSRESPATLRDAYAAALGDYLKGAGEAALTLAYELGRRAGAEGVGLLEIATLHHEALRDISPKPSEAATTVALAGQFLSESLATFEMTLRSYQANARLLGLSETLAEKNAEIDRSRAQLRMILDATTAVISLKDALGRYLFVNEAFAKALGRERDSVVGRTDPELFSPATAEVLAANDRLALEGQVPRETEEALSLHNGIHVYLSLRFPLLDEHGTPYALCCVATDVTERKRTEDAIRAAKMEAEAANRELESFSYSVAHDLRAPLRAIDGFSRILLEDCSERLDEGGLQHLRYIIDSVHEMGELIDGLLALSRLARSEIRREEVDLTTACRKIRDRLQALQPERVVDFVVQDGVRRNGDEHLLVAVLENLVGNAWKFTRQRARARIEFGELEGSDASPCFVRDNGAGFDMKYASRLFSAFQRLHRAEDFEGTGIGLATVQRIVSRHGGRVWAEAAVDGGATFYFTLG